MYLQEGRVRFWRNNIKRGERRESGKCRECCRCSLSSIITGLAEVRSYGR
jgi:hypothetical protein